MDRGAAGGAAIEEMHLTEIIVGDRGERGAGAALRIEQDKSVVVVDDLGILERRAVIEDDKTEARIVDCRGAAAAEIVEFGDGSAEPAEDC